MLSPGPRYRDRSLRRRWSGGLVLEYLGLTVRDLAVHDLDRARLHRLGHFTDQVDAEDAIGEAGTGDLDMIGQCKAPLERPGSDAAIEEFLVLLGFLLLAGNDQRIGLLDQGDVALAEARHRHDDAIGVFARLLDVVRRVGDRAVIEAGGRVEQPGQPVEPDGGTEKGTEIESL